MGQKSAWWAGSIAAIIIFAAPFTTAALAQSDPATPAAPAPPTTQSTAAASTAAAESLYNAMLKSVELVQQSIRSAKPVKPPASVQNKTSVQRQAASTAPVASNEIAKELAEQLVGKAGLISFRVSDVHDNQHPPTFMWAPAGVTEMRGKTAYLILGDVDNPTPTYMSESTRVEVQKQKRHGGPFEPALADMAIHDAAKHKPLHEVWIFSDDPSAGAWTKQSRHTVYARVISAKLTTVPGNYVKAILVLQTEPRPTTQPADGG